MLSSSYMSRQMTLKTLLAASLLASIHLVSTQTTDAPVEAQHFQPDRLSIANMVVSCAFGAAFIVFTVLCILVIKRNQTHRAPFVSLCAASLFTAVYSFVEIGHLVIVNIVPSEGYGDGDIFLVVGVFFSFWARSLLYLTLVLVLYDRHKSNSREDLMSCGKMWFNSLFGLFAVTILSATVAGGLFAVTEALDKKLHVEGGSLTEVEEWEYIDTYQRSSTAIVAFVMLWGVAATCASCASMLVYKSMRLTTVLDRITRIMRNVMMPLGIVGVIAGVVLTIYSFMLVTDLVLDILYSSMTVVLLYMGLKPELWSSPAIDDDATVARVRLDTRFSEAFVKVEGPPQHYVRARASGYR